MPSPPCPFCNAFPAGDRSDAHAGVSPTCLQIVTTMRVNAYGQPAKPWLVPEGVNPSEYIATIRKQGQTLYKASLYKPAVEMYRRCLPLIAFYYRDAPRWEAQAAGQLAVAVSMIGTPYATQEAETWAHWAFETYVNRMLDNPPDIADLTDELNRLRGAFPYVWRIRDRFKRCGVPDFTKGKLIRPRGPKKPAKADSADGESGLKSGQAIR